MRIGEFSQRTDVKQRLLRYYEEQGLLKPSRRTSGYREYTEADVTTVRAIRLLLGAGLNTATIAELLPCLVDEGQFLTPTCAGILPDLNRERERLNKAVADLLTARDTLDSVIATAAPAEADTLESCVAAGITREPAALSTPGERHDGTRSG